MQTSIFPLSPPSLEELANRLSAPLAANFEQSAVQVVECPDLREAPFNLATQGLCGDEKIADVGGQPNLFPVPRLDAIWSFPDIIRAMDMNPEKGSLIGAGAGPFHHVGQNCELSPNLSWEAGLEKIKNETRSANISRSTQAVTTERCASLDCALMINLFGSNGEPGKVLKITAKGRKGPERSFTECIRKGLYAAYGDSRVVSLGGAFLIKSGRALYHVMPGFPQEQDLPFEDFGQLDKWLTYHTFEEPMVCLSVLHSADPGKKMGLRMEHTHGFSSKGGNAGGHYHYDVEGEETVEYEAYFNTAKVLYRIDKPDVTLDRDLHD